MLNSERGGAEAERTPWTDGATFQAAVAGDAQAMGEVVAAALPRVLRYAQRMCSDARDAEDVAQDALVAAARGLGAVREAQALPSWLFQVVRRACQRKRRRRAGEPEAWAVGGEVEVMERGAGPEEAVLQAELGRRLTGALNALDREAREVIVLRDIEGMSAEEVSAITGKSVGSVKSRLHRARAELRRRLEDVAGREDEVRGAEGCPDVVRAYSQKVEGEISGAMCAALEAHLEGCERCRARCASLQRVLGWCRREGERNEGVPGALEARVRSAIEGL